MLPSLAAGSEAVVGVGFRKVRRLTRVPAEDRHGPEVAQRMGGFEAAYAGPRGKGVILGHVSLVKVLSAGAHQLPPSEM